MPDLKKRVLSSFKYNPKTGIVIRIMRKCWGHQTKVKQIAGTKDHHGYIRTVVRMDGEIYRLNNSHIAWLFMTGDFPPKHLDVDHKNRNKLDNRWSNLRLATRGQNNINSGNPSNNTTGQKGVHPTRGRWFSRIKVDGKVMHLGVFKKFEDAVFARKQAEKKHFGKFC